MKFKVKKEELNKFFKSINMFAHVTEDVILEGEPVDWNADGCHMGCHKQPVEENYCGCGQRYNNHGSGASGHCTKRIPQPIELLELQYSIDLHDVASKLNELIRDRNEKSKL